MASYLLPPLYAAFVWWFSTGAVLLLVGRRGRSDGLKIVCAVGFVAAAVSGLALAQNDISVGGAYLAFTCTILLWGAQEIAFLAGWLTGPEPRACPPEARGWNRLQLALRAILYHELALLACGIIIAALAWNGANRIGLWTFAALWVLRQSAKINLFIGVPVTNDELMPDAVRFLKTFFARKPVGAFFPVSVTLATAALVIMIQRIVEVAATPFEVVGLTLVSTMFALGVVEHWFMLLPMPAITLWGWGMRSGLPPGSPTMEREPVITDTNASPRTTPAFQQSSTIESRTGHPQLVVVTNARKEEPPARQTQSCARQRLEDQFRQRFHEEHARDELATAIELGAGPAKTVNGRTS